MEVFVFDLLPYGEQLDYLKVEGRLPSPLGKRHFKPGVATRTYNEHLAAWEAMERAGFDGISFNEHHGTPYGIMNSPNLMAAAISQRTKKMKILIYGNLLPIHNPLRLAEEIAMLDCLTDGRLICGVARGAPREYRYFDVPLGESRVRFEECFEIMRRAWTEESFTFKGEFHSYTDIAIWPRPVQQPHPPVWVPITGSRESIEWAARVGASITPGSGMGLMGIEVRDAIVRHFARAIKERGERLTPERLSVQLNCYVADSKAKAVDEAGPYMRYLFNTLFPFDQGDFSKVASSGYSGSSILASAQPPRAGARPNLFSGMTAESLREMVETMPWGSPDEVAERIIAEAEAVGAGTALLMFGFGAMPQEMYLNQVRRFGEEIVPRLKAHKIAHVPAAVALG